MAGPIQNDDDFMEFGDDNRGNSRDYHQKDAMIKITGLSRKKDRNGNTYLIGANNALSQYLVLPNTHKREPSNPDYYLFMRTNPKAVEFDSNRPNSINI